jgi:hypothetical protein
VHCNQIAWHIRSLWGVWGVGITFRVVQDDFLDLRYPYVSIKISSLRAAMRLQPLTCALAYNKPPPMGANMMPMAKNKGRTVLGVRIGLWCV